jgi:hypothetical protein
MGASGQGGGGRSIYRPAPGTGRHRALPSTDGSGSLDDVVLDGGVFLTDGGYAGARVRGMDAPDAGAVGMTVGASMGARFHTA